MSNTIRHIVLDIEGTTCAVSFVSDVLFPYAAREVGPFLRRQGDNPEIRTLVEAILEAWEGDQDGEAKAMLASCKPLRKENSDRHSTCSSDEAGNTADLPVLRYIGWLILRNRKLTPWKDLQGKIWQEGYARGDLKAPLYPEVADTLKQWKRLGLHLSVYSSGSVAAQRLLYGHSTDGDLTGLFSHWFDTHIGAKQQSDSYRAILDVIEAEASSVLFISDAVAELQAAEQAGLRVLFSDREGNPERDSHGFVSLTSLDQVKLDWS